MRKSNFQKEHDAIMKQIQKIVKYEKQLAEKDALIKQYENGEIIPAKVAKQSFEMRDDLLAEKDKEIERLKTKSEDYVIIERNFYNNLQEQLTEMKQIEEMLKQSRHQVCEEIRDKCIYVAGTKRVCENTSISTYNLNKILYQIEQGENK